MAKTDTKLSSGSCSIRSTSEDLYGVQKINFSFNHAIKPVNRLPDYICSRVDEDIWRVTYSGDRREDKYIEILGEYDSPEEIASAIDRAYQSAFDQTS